MPGGVPAIPTPVEILAVCGGGALDWERPLFVSLETEAGQDLGSLFLDRFQLLGIKAQFREDRRRDLRSLHWAGHRTGREARVRHQHDHVDVVMRKPAMFGEFLAAAR